MNDPGLDEPISSAAGQAREARQDQHGTNETGQSKEGNKERAMPTRWWYASTAFPLLAGTFGPMANAFSICALVENWRVEVPPDGTEEHGIDIEDPRWLIGVNAVSLAFALIANLSLLLNMAKRVRFAIAQPITILGFWVASVLLIGLLSYGSTSGFDAKGVQNQALTQAYYYGICAAALYQIISYLMCVTVWGAYRGAYSKDFELTVAQRTLMLQTISFLAYLLLGALIYSHIEQWKFLDAVYFMDFTLLTVGIGDYAPITHLGRSLLFPTAIGGIITIGLVVSSIRSLVLERGAEKMSARMTEKTRARVVKQIAQVGDGAKTRTKPLFGISKGTAEDLVKNPAKDHITELKRRKIEFETMRSVQEMAAHEREYISLTLSIIAFAILWFIGAFVFWRAERNQQWTYFQALYFSYTSVITVGYGDFSPMSNSGKPFFVFWSLLAVPTLTILISNMGDTVVKGVKDVTIFIGEISFLPSNEGHTRDRLKLGANKATFGLFDFLKPATSEEEDFTAREEADEDWSEFKELHPGLVAVFDASDHKKINRDDLRVLDRLTDAWGEAEEENEEMAKEKRDRRAQAEHHYRHLLISHISKIYADTRLTTPKKYSYAEWSFYLKLIGEDESNASLHRRALPKSKARTRHQNKQTEPAKPRQASHDDTSDEKVEDQKARDTTKWSWIGQYSPLMQDKDEAEWILERLFEQLEESLRPQNDIGNEASKSGSEDESHSS